MRRRDVRTYNIMLPLWLLLVWPTVLPLVVLLNTAFDGLVLSLGMRRVGVDRQLRSTVRRKRLWKIVLAGFAADLVGAILLTLSVELASSLAPDGGSLRQLVDSFCHAVMFDPLSSPLGGAWVLACTAVSAIVIYQLNRRWCLAGCGLSEEQLGRLCLVMAICTAPYTFLFPSALLYP